VKAVQRVLVGVLCAVVVWAGQSASSATPLGPIPTLADIVAKNAAARGGKDAWHKVQTMVWGGHVESKDAPPGRTLQFLLEQKRPNRTRFEIFAEGQRSVRIYDGSSGWKLRAGSTGRPESQPYTEDELRFARGAQVIDGALMDYVARGATITLRGSGDVDGRRANVLDIRTPSGELHHLWVDAETFLEARQDREVRGASGAVAVTTVFYRDYRPFEGLQIPVVVEAASAAGATGNKLVIEKVAINPELDDGLFAKPQLSLGQRHGATVDTRGVAPGAAPRPAAPQ
jgi:hypothetical protein